MTYQLDRSIGLSISRAATCRKRNSSQSKRLTGSYLRPDYTHTRTAFWSIISNDCCIGNRGVAGGANDGCFALQRDSFCNIQTRSPAKCSDGERDRIAVASHAMEALDIFG